MKTTKKITKKVSETFLGTISSIIVGIQYYDGKVQMGEEVIFEREPDNTHDAKAIRVENPDFGQIGNLPRNIVAWLSPLIDAGKIRITGSLSQDDDVVKDDHQYSIPMLLKIYLCNKGRAILQEKKQPQNDLEALHEVE